MKSDLPPSSAREPKRPNGLLRSAASLLAESPFLRRGRGLWHKNEIDWNLPLSKWDKLHAGAFLILRDYSRGDFPPAFHDQHETHQNEINYRFAVPGMTAEAVAHNELTKPFWFGASVHNYLNGFLKLLQSLERADVRPPAKLLELGGGSGWIAELLAQLGYNVVCSTISPDDVATAQKRLEGLRAKGAPCTLTFKAAPMESVATCVADLLPFDAVFVFEALHHAFDWRAAISSSHECLRPGGWILICNEPNLFHTAVSYRVARLSNTHEIGFRKGDLRRHLIRTGFRRIISLGKRPHLFFRPHWLIAQK